MFVSFFYLFLFTYLFFPQAFVACFILNEIPLQQFCSIVFVLLLRNKIKSYMPVRQVSNFSSLHRAMNRQGVVPCTFYASLDRTTCVDAGYTKPFCVVASWRRKCRTEQQNGKKTRRFLTHLFYKLDKFEIGGRYETPFSDLSLIIYAILTLREVNCV